jgi:hypothetical protein
MDPFALPDPNDNGMFVLTANSAVDGGSWQAWSKPMNKTMAVITVIGGGGGGGSGVIGANSTAGGGGGGGGAGVTTIQIPLALLPPRLYVSIPFARTGAGAATYVSVRNEAETGFIDNLGVIAMANGGTAGGNASGATGGSAGGAAAIAPTSSMPLGMTFLLRKSTGAPGGAGSGNTTAASVSVLTALRVTGGTGGGGLGATATNGSRGGDISISGLVQPYPTLSGGTAPTAATTPPGVGRNGVEVAVGKNTIFYGGTGGSSTHGSATGAALVQAAGGNGAPGCGGGGSGAALTGSVPADPSLGGPGLVIINCF